MECLIFLSFYKHLTDLFTYVQNPILFFERSDNGLDVFDYSRFLHSQGEYYYVYYH